MKVQLSPEAEKDLFKTKFYIANNLSNPIAAENVTKRITKRLRSLSDNPRLGSPLSSIVDVETDYRYLLCSKYYMAFYRIEEKRVYVDRIIDGRRNYMKILFGLPEEDEEE